MLPVNLYTPPEPLNHRAATKIQSFFRGYQIRKSIVLPSPLLDLLLCSQINSFLSQGKGVERDLSAEIIKDRKFFIKRDKNQGILTVVFPREDLIGSGFWKKCFSATNLKIPLNGNKRDVNQFQSVWMQLDIKMIQEMELHKFLYDRYMEQKPRGIYFLEPWEHVHENTYTQRRLINKLDETEFEDPVQKSRCLRDIARTLVWIHRQGVVHGDVHLKNMLVERRIDEEGILRLVPYLTDFGSTKAWGAGRERNLDDYVRWDTCKCFADINTPLVDWHGFIVTNIVSWFPEMASHLKWGKFITTRYTVFQDVCKGDFQSAELYWTDCKPFSDRTRQEQRAWKLFIALCVKSTELYLYLSDKTAEITKEEIEEGMIRVQAEVVINECLQFTYEMCDLAIG